MTVAPTAVQLRVLRATGRASSEQAARFLWGRPSRAGAARLILDRLAERGHARLRPPGMPGQGRNGSWEATQTGLRLLAGEEGP